MASHTIILGILATSAAAGIFFEQIRLRHYWQRTCTGKEWKSRFPSASKQEIRSFLNLFVKAFGFSKIRQLKFSPNDKVTDIYRALYPLKEMPDGLEIETFVKLIHDHYRIDLESRWHTEITLGELFEHISNKPSAQSDLAHA